MRFDIVDYSPEELEKLTAVQMQLLRAAQKKKDELLHKMNKDLAAYKKLMFTNGMGSSTLFEQMQDYLTGEMKYQVEIIKEQLEYSMALNAPCPEPGEGGEEEAGYIVDYSLPYTDRYAIVRAYYLAIEDPVERMNLYNADEIAKKYLGEFYWTLYNVLTQYSAY